MADLSKLSTEELKQIAGVDVSQASTAQLRQQAGLPFQFGGGGAPQVGAGGPTPPMSGLEATRLRARAFGTSAANVGLFGVPEIVSQKLTGQSFVPSGAPGFEAAGSVAGFLTGGPTKLIKGARALASKAIPSAKFLPQVLKGAIAGAAGGASVLPSPAETPNFKKEVIKRMGIGATIGGLFEVAAAPARFTRWLKVRNQIKLSNKIRNNLVGQKQALVENFGKQYDDIVTNTKGNIDLNESFRGLLDNVDDSLRDIQGQFDFNTALAEGSADARRLNNLVRTYLRDPNVSRPVSLREADKLQKAIRQLPGIKNKLNQATRKGFEQVDFTNSERILLELSNDIKTQVLNNAPDLGILNRQYGEAVTNLKRIRPFFKFNSAIPTMRNLHTPQLAEARNLMNNVFPSGIVNEMNTLNRATRAATLGGIVARRGAFIAGAGAAAGAVGGRVFGGFGGE